MKPNVKTMNQNDYWDCPTCGRPTPTEIDVECHCGMMSSHHVSVRELCKRMRESQQRESALIVRNKKLEDEVNEQARLLGMSAERECDLRGKIERFERDLESRRDLFKIQDNLMDELREERALCNWLADSLLFTLSSWINSPDANHATAAIQAWKEARSE